MDPFRFPRHLDHTMPTSLLNGDRTESSLFPYWKGEQSLMNMGNDNHQVIDDEQKFAVTLDVSQYRPEELKVRLEGRELVIEGKQEQRTDTSTNLKSFMRKWTLPESVNLDAVNTQLNEKGRLYVEAPKTTGRNIPVMASSSR